MSNEVSRSHVSTSPEMQEARDAMDAWIEYEQSGVGLIEAERARQREIENYDSSHDDAHKLGELSQAAVAYAGVASAQTRGASSEEFPADMMILEGEWPWEEDTWKPSSDPIRNLVKAGALIAAEIDRLRRLRK